MGSSDVSRRASIPIHVHAQREDSPTSGTFPGTGLRHSSGAQYVCATLISSRPPVYRKSDLMRERRKNLDRGKFSDLSRLNFFEAALAKLPYGVSSYVCSSTFSYIVRINVHREPWQSSRPAKRCGWNEISFASEWVLTRFQLTSTAFGYMWRAASSFYRFTLVKLILARAALWFCFNCSGKFLLLEENVGLLIFAAMGMVVVLNCYGGVSDAIRILTTESVVYSFSHG